MHRLLKLSILLLIFYFEQIQAQYQRDWTRPYSVAQSGAPQTATDNLSNTYVGFSTNVLGPPDGGAYLLKYNSLGFLEWAIHDTDAFYVGGIKISASGDVYIAISFCYGNVRLQVRKYSSGGNLIWQNNDNSSGIFSTSNYYDMDLDNNGNIIVTGSWSDNGLSALTSKIDTSGNLVWQKTFAFSTSSCGRNIIIDQSNNILVGVSDGVIKYNSNGNELWHLQLNIGSSPSSFKVDSQGNIYVGGVSNTTSNYMMVISKLSGAGSLLWTRSFGPSDAFTSSLELDAADNVYVTGGVGGSMNPAILVSNILLKLSPLGDLLWSRNYNGNATAPVDYAQNSLIIKRFGYNDFFLYGGIVNNTTGSDGFVCKIDTSGTPLWQDIFDNNDTTKRSETWRQLTTDSNGNLYLSGSWAQGTNSGTSNIMTMKYSAGYNGSRPSINGKLFNDLNQNCITDTLDFSLISRMVELLDSNNNTKGYSITDTAGNFNFYCPMGQYFIKPVIQTYSQSTCSNGVSVTLQSNTDTSYNNNVGLYIPTNVQDLQISVTGGIVRPGQNTTYAVLVKNQGTKIMSGSIMIDHDIRTQFVNSTRLPDSTSNSSIFWSYGNLQCQQSVYFQFVLVADTSLAMWDTLGLMSALIEPAASDTTPSNNFDTLALLIKGPFDPNHKSVNYPETILINDTSFTYTIQFQNLGNDTAINITVRDTLSNLFDLSTLNMGASIHPYYVSFIGNVMYIHFQNILLPPKSVNEDASQGSVRYSITRKRNIIPGTHVNNSAAIFFDYMPAVLTNTTSNLFIDPSFIDGLNENNSLRVFPNPASNEINVVWDRKYRAILYDLYGRVLLQKDCNEANKIGVESLTQGVYLLMLVGPNEIHSKKILILK